MVEQSSKGSSKSGKGKGGKKGKAGGKKGGKEKGGKGADAVSRATTDLHTAARAGDLSKLDELIAQAKEQAKVEAAKAIAAREEAEAKVKVKAEAKEANETKEENAEAGGAGAGGEGPKAEATGESPPDSQAKVATKEEVADTKEEVADADEASAKAGGSDAHEADGTAEANASSEESKQFVRLMNVLDQHRRTPLHLACFIGQEEAVEKLLENGADPRKEAMDGYLPLHFAAQAGHVGVLRLLVRRLAAGRHGDVKRYVNRAVTKGKRSALQLALQKKHADCARFLVSKGAVIDDDCREDMKELCGEAATLLAMKAAAAEARKSTPTDSEGGGPVGPSLPPGAALAPADAQIGPALPPAVAAKLARALAEEEEEEPVAAEGAAAEAGPSLPPAEEDSAEEPKAKRARVVDKDLDDDDCI